MKINLFIVCLSLSFIVACERKTDSEPKVSATPIEVIQKTSEPLPVSATSETPNKVQHAEIKAQESVKASAVSVGLSMKKTTPQAPQDAKVSTEQSLADTADHARNVTKSQVSSSRQRADKAESEMDDMLKNK